MTKMRFTEEIRETMRNEFVQGVTDTEGYRSYPTIEDLVTKHSVPKTTVYRYAKKEGWKDQRREFQQGFIEKSDANKQGELVSEGKRLDLTSISLAKAIMVTVGTQLSKNRALEEQGMDGLTGHQINALSNSALNAQKLAKLALGETTEKVSIDADSTDRRAFGEVMSLLDTVRDGRREGDGGAVR